MNKDNGKIALFLAMMREQARDLKNSPEFLEYANKSWPEIFGDIPKPITK